MSIHKSYFSKNNTIVKNSEVNTAKNPVTELFFGDNFSRFIFDIDITDLTGKTSNNIIIPSNGISHKLKMINTSFFDVELLNTKGSAGKRRASSFDIILFKITGSTVWDEGVGYDMEPIASTFDTDKTYSTRPSNYFSATTLSSWTVSGIYNNVTLQGLQILGQQHFDNGNENVEIDITSEINDVISGSTIKNGYGIAYIPAIENITGLTENYYTGFYTKYTQTFFEPFLLTTYNDLVEDDRGQFYENKLNKLYLYVNQNGQPSNLTNLPSVSIYDASNTLFSALTATQVTQGIYSVSLTVPSGLYSLPCQFKDVWSGLTISGNALSNSTNKFVVYPASDYYNIGTNEGLPKDYGFSFSGIKRDEKIASGEVRKIIVSVRKPFTVNEREIISGMYYRLYVRQGMTEYETQEWTSINRGFTQNYFILDTGDMIPNEYFLDLKVISNWDTNIYKSQIKFQISDQI